MGGIGQDEARSHESWFDSRFGRRAEKVEGRMLSDLLSDLDGPGSLVDIGCGTGRLSNLWQSHGMWSVGVDSSAGRVAFAYRERPAFRVVMGDGMSLPFREGSFDLAAIVTVLEFVPAPERVLLEAARVARKGLVVAVLNKASPVAWWCRVARDPAYLDAQFYSPEEARQLVFRSLGQRVAACHTMTALYPIAWMDGLRGLPLGAVIGISVRLSPRA